MSEIAFDLQPIATGATPATSDKLAQRNLAIVSSDNPGSIASHRIPHTFDVTPTPSTLLPGELPDELMIDWGNTPAGSTAAVYLPAVSTDAVLKMAADLYPAHSLQRLDDHTLRSNAGGMIFIPIPPGVGSKFAGLLTVDLPATVTKGQVFKVVIRQVTNSSRRDTPPPPPPPPPPKINLGGGRRPLHSSSRDSAKFAALFKSPSRFARRVSFSPRKNDCSRCSAGFNWRFL